MTQNKEIIEKLEKLDQLLDEAYELNEYAENGCIQEYGRRAFDVKLGVEDLNGAPSAFSSIPSFPMDKEEYEKVEQGRKSQKKLFLVTLAITVLCFFIYSKTYWGFLNFITTIGVFASIFFGYIFVKGKKDYIEQKKKYDDSVKAHEKSTKAFKDAISVFDSEKAQGIELAKSFAQDYKKSYEAFNKLLEEAAQKRIDAMEKFVAKMQEVKEYDFMPPEYYHLIGPVIKLLKSGRADDYKEALNLAIQEEREEQEAAARRAEDAERTRIMRQQAEAEERRAMEERRHNEAMERQQRQHDQAMERQQQQHNRAMVDQQRRQAEDARRQAEQQRRDAQNQANKTKSAGISKCASCANSRHCPSHIKNSGSGLTCGGYRPYGS